MKEMNRSWYLFATLFCLAFSGCASLSKEACLQGDWHGVGYEDGSKGRLHSRLVVHEQACLEFNITPDEKSYMRGWNQGVQIYCTKQRGYDEGEDMEDYKWVCPKELEPVFLKGYLMGLDAAENKLRRELSKLDRKIIKETVQLNELKGEKYEKQIDKIKALEWDLETTENDISDIYDLRRKFGL